MATPPHQRSGIDWTGLEGEMGQVAEKHGLSLREMQVLTGINAGLSNSEIGRELFISEDTVKTHTRRMFRKIDAHNRAHAVGLAWRKKIFRLKSDVEAAA